MLPYDANKIISVRVSVIDTVQIGFKAAAIRRKRMKSHARREWIQNGITCWTTSRWHTRKRMSSTHEFHRFRCDHFADRTYWNPVHYGKPLRSMICCRRENHRSANCIYSVRNRREMCHIRMQCADRPNSPAQSSSSYRRRSWADVSTRCRTKIHRHPNRQSRICNRSTTDWSSPVHVIDTGGRVAGWPSSRCRSPRTNTRAHWNFARQRCDSIQSHRSDKNHRHAFGRLVDGTRNVLAHRTLWKWIN